MSDNVVDLAGLKKTSPFGPVAAGLVGTTTVVKPLLAEIEEWVVDAVRETAPLGEEYGFHVDLMLMPTPMGPQPATTIFLTGPSPIIGQKLAQMGVLPGLGMPKEAIVETVKTLVRQMGEERQNILTGGSN